MKNLDELIAWTNLWTKIAERILFFVWFVLIVAMLLKPLPPRILMPIGSVAMLLFLLPIGCYVYLSSLNAVRVKRQFAAVVLRIVAQRCGHQAAAQIVQGQSLLLQIDELLWYEIHKAHRLLEEVRLLIMQIETGFPSEPVASP